MPSSCMRASTWFLRSRAARGSSTGSHRSGPAMRPARRADSRSVSALTGLEKYSLAAALIPYAPWPKYTVFR